jgi:hypothetical protein
MAQWQLRLRFYEESETPPTALLAQIKKDLQAEGDVCGGWVAEHMAHLKIPENERHYWSPQLTLQVEKRGDGSYIRGLYGPNPTVWTMFVFFYTLFAVIGLIGTIFGLSQLQLGYPAWALWALPISLVAIAALYLAARRGQRIGSQQTHILDRFWRQSLERT